MKRQWRPAGYPDPCCPTAPPYWQHERLWRARYLHDVCRSLAWLLQRHHQREVIEAGHREHQRWLAEVARRERKEQERQRKIAAERWRAGGFKLFDRHARSLEQVNRWREEKGPPDHSDGPPLPSPQ